MLDGGRGLVAAVTGSVLVAVYAALLPDDPATASLQQRTEAFRQVIQLTIVVTVAAALFLWLVLPNGSRADATAPIPTR